jgi:LAO/AO transport system kinase
MDVVRLADLTALVVAPGLGDDIQAMKAGLLEVADLLVINKADCPGAEGLALDLETAARGRPALPDGLNRVCLTTASENLGVIELAATFDRLDSQRRLSGEHEKQRLLSRRLEVLDWALEMVRPRLETMIDPEEARSSADPRLLASNLVASLFGPER